MKRRGCRTYSASYYWGSSHREESPGEKERGRISFLERVVDHLGAECRAKDDTIVSLNRMLHDMTDSLRLCRSERDEARRRLESFTVEAGGGASGVEELKASGEYWKGKYERLLEKHSEAVRENCALKRKLNIRDGKESVFGANGAPSLDHVFKGDSTDENRERKGGARKGHRGHGRRKIAEAQAGATPEACSRLPAREACCGAPELCPVGTRRREYDRYIPARWDHVVLEETIYKCSGCGKVVYARPSDVLPRMSYSNTCLVHVAGEIFLNGHTAKSVALSLGMRPGTLFNLLDILAERLRPAYDAVMASSVMQKVLHADETQWWIDGKKGYAWVFTNRNIYLVMLKDTRGSCVPASLFGYRGNAQQSLAPGEKSIAESLGVALLTLLVTDRYGGYLPVNVEHQFCFEHLKRDLDRLLQFSPGLEEVEAFCGQFRPLLAESMHLCADGALDDASYYARASALRERFRALVYADARDAGLRGYQDIWRDNWDHLFHWVERRDVRCENNTAERAIHPVVITRKASFGSQGKNGAENREIITSVLKTVELRGVNPREWLLEVLDKMASDTSFDVADALPPSDKTLEFEVPLKNTG